MTTKDFIKALHNLVKELEKEIGAKVACVEYSKPIPFTEPRVTIVLTEEIKENTDEKCSNDT